MQREIGVVMDPMGSIKIAKDSTFAMLLAAGRRQWRIQYMELSDLFLRDDRAWARMREVQVWDDAALWYRFCGEQTRPLDTLPVILMRKDPPFDMEYIYATYLLERAQAKGVRVVNDPRSLRDANEKLFILQFPHCCPPILVTRRNADIAEFLARHGEVILKPLDGMGGRSIFRVPTADPNFNVIVETLTDHGNRFCMAQKFIPEIADGDKRILLIDGDPVPYALARIPKPGETRGNLAAGGTGVGQSLTERDRRIASQVGPELRRRGILFAGLDVIGDYLTEINITSPTCIRELDAWFGLDIAGNLMTKLAEQMGAG
ncbi:glutathione synthase [Candidatus Thiosymbion oneisti]|uniref:glutathione synthase n=1 Tax=Candidatus Thiosymbion oneisti TaxID=589554 RepID=UPI000AB64DE5|nr:glutathione synthase [Candidatus Thiosymbion oneisti]